MEPLDADYGRLSPLEYLALADRERIHTETLRWLFSEDSPLPSTNRLTVLERLAGRTFPGRLVTGASTEQEYVDLVVDLEHDGRHEYVALENKLKSAEHSEQLRRYDTVLDRRGDSTKLFLTLLGEDPRSSADWRPISYTDLYDAVALARPERHTEYVTDYEQLLRRLLGAVQRVLTTSDAYAGNGAVFDERIAQEPPTDFLLFARYIRKMRLRTLLQQAWMRGLGLSIISVGSVAFSHWQVSESRGAASLQFDFTQVRDEADRAYSVGVQLQHGSFKVFCAPYPYAKGAGQQQSVAAERTLLRMQQALGLPGRKLTTARTHGFRSFKASELAPHGTLAIAAWHAALEPVLRRVGEAASQL